MEQPISLTEAKKFLRLEYSDEDQYIESLIVVAREQCEKYIRKPIDVNNCPESIRQAMLLVVGHFYENRETETNAAIPETVHYLLNPYREVKW